MADVLEQGILPHDTAMQEAVLGYMLVDKAFFLKCVNHLRSGWFRDGVLGVVFTEMSNFYKAVHQPPASDLEIRGYFVQYEMAEVNVYNAALTRCIEMKNYFGLENIKQQINNWIVAMKLREALQGAADLYNKRRLDEVTNYLFKALSEINHAAYSDEGRVPFTATKSWFDNTTTDHRNICTTGIEAFDRALLGGSPGDGALLPGDTTIFLAPANTGKTTTLITLIKHNIFLRGKDVLWVTHEDHPDNLKRKMFLCAMDTPDKDILRCYENEEGLAKVAGVQDTLEAHLVYIPYNKAGGMYVESVMSMIKSEQMSWKQSHGGKGFDIVVCDYPARLNSSVKTRSQDFEVKGYVYNEFIQMAIEESLHCLLAVQGNRNAMIANKNDPKFIGGEFTAGSIDIVNFCSNFITINRNEEDRKNNRIIFYIEKNRQGERGKAVICTSRFECYTTHSQQMGASVLDSNEREGGGQSGQSGSSMTGVDLLGKPLDPKLNEFAIIKEDAALRPSANDTAEDIAIKRAAQEVRFDEINDGKKG